MAFTDAARFRPGHSDSILCDAPIANALGFRRRWRFDNFVGRDLWDDFWSLRSLLPLPQPEPMMSESSELSKVVGSIASSLISDSGRGAFSFVSHLAFRQSAEPYGNNPYVFVDQHVEERCCVSGVGAVVVWL
jgi:hypothetical protein